MWWLLWWGFVLGSSYYASRAWGTPAGIGSVIALYVSWAILPLGYWISLVGSVAIGARAEQEIEAKQITAS